MSISLVVGAQYGHEGKGKVCRWWSELRSISIAVKIGGYTPKTFYDRKLDKMITSKMIPASNNMTDTTLYLYPKSCMIDIDLLLKEANERGIENKRFIFDEEVRILKDNKMTTVQHIMNNPEISEKLNGIRIMNVTNLLSEINVDNDNVGIIIEGDGGYELAVESKIKYWNFPNPNMVASGICLSVGLSPNDIGDDIFDKIILVGEIYNPHWEYCECDLDYAHIYGERRPMMASKTDCDGYMNYDSFINAITANTPDLIIINGLEKVDPEMKDQTKLSDKQLDALDEIEDNLGIKVDYVSNGGTMIAYLDNQDAIEEAIDDVMNKSNHINMKPKSHVTK